MKKLDLGFRATQRRKTGKPGGDRRAREARTETRTGRTSYCSSSVLPVFQTNVQYLHSLQRNHHIVLGLSSINPSRCSECGSTPVLDAHSVSIERVAEADMVEWRRGEMPPGLVVIEESLVMFVKRDNAVSSAKRRPWNGRAVRPSQTILHVALGRRSRSSGLSEMLGRTLLKQ